MIIAVLFMLNSDMYTKFFKDTEEFKCAR